MEVYSGGVKTTNEFAVPRGVYIPRVFWALFDNSLEDPKQLLCFEELVRVMNASSVGTLLAFNRAYQEGDESFFTNELINGKVKDSRISMIDLLSLYQKQASVNPELLEHLDAAQKSLDGINLTGISKLVESDRKDEQFYVPAIFHICDDIYGIRLVSVPSAASAEAKEIALKNLAVLGNHQPLSKLAKSNYFADIVNNVL